MTTARTIWLIWCLGWAAFWVFMAPFTFGLSLFVAGQAQWCATGCRWGRPRHRSTGQDAAGPDSGRHPAR